MKLFSKYISQRFKAINGFFRMGCIPFLMILMASCVDENLSPCDPSLSEEDSIEGYSLGFMLQLDKSFSSRAGEDKDNWIDTQDKFRVFFFTKEGEFLFGAIDRSVTHVSSGGDFTHDYWYVRIPVNMILDRQGNEYDINMIKNYLKNNEFKVAVLANWPNAGAKVSPGSYDDGDDTGDFKENESSVLKGNPNWGLRNSVIYSQTYDPSNDLHKKIGVPDPKNINDLHHLFDESKIYADQANAGSSDKASKLETYQPFMEQVTDDDGSTYWAMGEPTDWVKMRRIDEDGAWKDGETPTEGFENKDEANKWIKKFCDPTLSKNESKSIYRHYQHLWYLWNFDAIYKTGLKIAGNQGDFYEAFEDNWGWDGVKNKWGKEWYERNGTDIYSKMKAVMGSNSSAIGDFSTVANQTGDKNNMLVFKDNNSRSRAVHIGSYYGIRMPSASVSTKIEDKHAGYFMFRARTAGTLRVKWGTYQNGTTATLCVQKNSSASPTTRTTTSTTPVDYDFDGKGTNYLDVSVGTGSFPMFIYSPDGTAVIYSIEYIRGKYLYDSDREGILPDETQGIPMYGVQNYDRIPEWTYGTTYNISSMQADLDGNNKNVYLIRALAKVEFYVPESWGMPRHVYMRSMNRSARCEPMDVETPTNNLWKDSHYSNVGNSPELCEWYYVFKYGPVYNASVGKALDNYRNWLSWFHGTWVNANWYKPKDKTKPLYTINTTNGTWTLNNNNVEKWKWSTGSITVPNSQPYPHLYNHYINRSDFCHMVYVGKSDTYNKFILYMPEKYIDDPTNVSVYNSTPKVPHIEYRFDPTDVNSNAKYNNSEFNLDDNDCYRIYFTNYGQVYDRDGKSVHGDIPDNKEILKSAVTGDQYDGKTTSYEQQVENLKMHWPIMRNHVYQFYLSGSGPSSPDVFVKVTDWSGEKYVVNW